MYAVMTMLIDIDGMNNNPTNKTVAEQVIDTQPVNEQSVQMKNQIISLTKRRKDCAFLTNTLTFRCRQCNSRHKESYYNILISGNFQLQSPVNTITTYIREGEYEEDVTVTPIVAKNVCTECNSEMALEFPVSLEYLLVILQSRPPDSNLYG